MNGEGRGEAQSNDSHRAGSTPPRRSLQTNTAPDLLGKAEISWAVEAALAAGQLIRERRPQRVDSKGAAGLVTEVDRASEELLRARLPGPFLGEEGGGSVEGRGWVVDPLDGTTNFVHGYPRVAVSIALVEGTTPVLGVVYDILRDELFTAFGGQAWRNGKPVRVSEVERLEDALLASGPFPGSLAVWQRLEKCCLGVRMDGCASLDLCYVACGRLDAFYERDLKPWDVAAGGLVLAAAGGRLSDFGGAPADPWTGDYVASNGRLHDTLLERCR